MQMWSGNINTAKNQGSTDMTLIAEGKIIKKVSQVKSNEITMDWLKSKDENT